jgi:predicted O-methyltransferase YrrM
MTFSHEEYVRGLYKHLLARSPGQDELSYWVERSKAEPNPSALVGYFIESIEYRNRVDPFSALPHPPGHFYSPINDIRDVEQAFSASFDLSQRLPGLDLNIEHQKLLWSEFVSDWEHIQLHKERTPGSRYFYGNDVYGPGDAFIVTAMIRKLKPKKIVEVGSGFSSACMLDAVRNARLPTALTFIDPHPETLFSLLDKSDLNQCAVLPQEIQGVELSLFETLRPKDILFIDSSHVMKYRSDVTYELFHILPTLAPGVVIHFHDVFFPFEYPREWIYGRKYSWNEIYGVRAFLMYNTVFKIIFFNHCFSILHAELVDKVSPAGLTELFMQNPGGGLWLEKQG